MGTGGFGTTDRLHLTYSYDSFGNIKTLGEAYNGGVTSNHNFAYDAQNRITDAFDQTFGWNAAGNLTNFNGTALTYDGGKPHAANKRGGVDRYDYDANGNMTVRNKGLSSQQTLTWDHENRLASLSGGGVSESYLYDDGGRRVKKVSGSTTWYYPFPQYEIQVTGTAAAAELASGAPYTLTVPVTETQTAVAWVYLPHVGTASSGVDAAAVAAVNVYKYYLFNGQRIALRGPGYLHYLHSDHLGSTVLTTYSSNGTRASERGYYAFGSERRADGPHLATDYRFTGQKVD